MTPPDIASPPTLPGGREMGEFPAAVPAPTARGGPPMWRIVHARFGVSKRPEPRMMELQVSLVSAGFCAVLTRLFWRGCLFAWSALASRGLGAMPLGIPRLVVSLHSRRLPLLVACLACGKKRPAAADQRPHCGSAFSNAAPIGTEVFSWFPEMLSKGVV